MNKDTLIDGITISNYRSFGPEPQRIGPLSKINLFVGKNNCGKSNVLRFIQQVVPWLTEKTSRRDKRPQLKEESNKACGISSDEWQIVIGFALSYNSLPPVQEYAQIQTDRNAVNEYIKTYLADHNGLMWHEYKLVSNETCHFRDVGFAKDVISKNIEIKTRFCRNPCEILWRGIRSKKQITGGVPFGSKYALNIVNEIYNDLRDVSSQKTNVILIPAIREITCEGEFENELNGKGVITKLHELKNPPAETEIEDERIFGKIEEFVRQVTNSPSAILKIPHKKDTILVNLNGQSFPLENLGTGIHEIIILAAACTIFQNCIVCIEEPEIHLHPLLLKQLIKYLYEETNNQYMIATHSPALLNSPECSVFHVTYDNNCSKVSNAIFPGELCSISHDLGLYPSDLLQTNCVIWVEGPSDRIYIRHWLNEVDSELEEDIHYTIMFYGGRLLSHLTFDDNSDELEDFIKLQSICRRACIVIDSDRKRKGGQVNETKNRLRKEFEKNSSFVWITSGKEIENYIAPEKIHDAIRAVHPSANKCLGNDEYESLLKYKPSGKKTESTADKVKVAKSICSQPADLDRLDLKEQVHKLARIIRKANDIKQK